VGRYAEAFQQSITDPDTFWGAAASGIDWYRQPTVMLDKSNPPFYRWFADGDEHLLQCAGPSCA
jgi:propionyl-CoA synthetase